MNLVSFDDVTLEFGDIPLLKHADFTISKGERVCLIGRNGAGKSSSLKLITGALQPDHGNIQLADNLRISQLHQELPANTEITVRDYVASGQADTLALLNEYETIAADASAQDMNCLERLQQQIDARHGWDIDSRIDAILTRLRLPADTPLKALSGGWRRRVDLGRALLGEPDVLLLDEPTNHLDIHTIEWLEETLLNFSGAILFITHDRRFLRRLATRIVEIDRGVMSSWPGDYDNFLRRKEALLEEEERQNALFDKKLAQEETWIRQGIKARRTRNEGRVRALKAMREERAKRINQQGKARIVNQDADKSGRKVIEARHVTHGYSDDPLINDFSINIMRGDRIGLVGNNGVGKTTLLRVLLGQEEPQQGRVKLGTNLQIAYFDQTRAKLDEQKTVVDIVGDGKDFVTINGRDVHVISYLQDFLFSPRRARSPVKALSGGERSRLVMARLFSQPANLLVMDEPTNDLDVEMLEVLEQRLVDYTGTLLLVSHDRDFLDNVVTSTVVFENTGLQEYVGGYSDWLNHNHQLAVAWEDEKATQAATAPAPQAKAASDNGTPRKKAVKLSYKLQRELDALPDQIAALEAEVEKLENQTSDPSFYEQEADNIEATLARLTEKQRELEHTMERWLELEEQKNGE